METVRDTWQYFPASEIELHRNNFLVSPCGTGKTTALAQWISENPELKIIVVTFRISLAFMLSKTYGFENYMDLKHESSLSLSEHPRTVVSIESLQKFFRSCDAGRVFDLPDVLIIDEYCSLIEHAFNIKTLDPSRRSLFFTFLFSMLDSPAKTVICADAFFSTDLDVDVFVMLSVAFPTHDLGKYKIIYNEYRKAIRRIRIWQSPKNWKNYLLATVKRNQKKIFLFVNNKTISDGICAELADMKGKASIESSYPASMATDCLYLSSDSSPDDVMDSSIDPNSKWSSYNFVSVTPTIQAGVSFDVTDHFDMGFGYAGLGSTQPLGILQQLARVRNYTDNIIELCVQKQTKSKPSREYPSIQEVTTILEKKIQSLNNRYSRCCEVNYTYNPEANLIKFGMSPKSIINCFAIRVARSEFFAKQSLLAAIVSMAEQDSYDVQVLTPSECKRLTLKYIRDWRIERLGDNPSAEDIMMMDLNMESRRKDALECYETSFPSTISKHRLFKSDMLFEDWDGFFHTSEFKTDAKSFSKTKAFMREWNILGAYGNLDDLIAPGEEFSLEYEFEKANQFNNMELELVDGTISFKYPDEYFRCVEFNPKNVGDFYCLFIADDKQTNFHTYITGDYRKLLKLDKDEANIGNTLNISNAFCFEFCVRLWSLMRICTFDTLKEHNWLGAQIDLHPTIALSVDQNINILKRECDSVFNSVDECILNIPEICEEIRLLFQGHWDHIYSTLIGAQYAPATRNIPSCFTTQVNNQNVEECLTFIRIVSDTIKNSLVFIGLRIDQQSKKIVRTASTWHHSGRRARLQQYNILNFDERLMISYCRYVKDKGYRLASMHHYPRCDPFNLLVYDIQPSSLSTFRLQSGLRFKRYLWAYPKSTPETHPLLKDLQQWAVINSTVRNREARIAGEIAQDETYLSSILPSLSNIRYYWASFRIGRQNELPLDVKLEHRLLRCTNEVHWQKLHNSLYNMEALDFYQLSYDLQREYMQTEIYQKTGLLKINILTSTDDTIVDAIKQKHRFPRKSKINII